MGMPSHTACALCHKSFVINQILWVIPSPTSKRHYLSKVFNFQSICQASWSMKSHYFEQVGREGRQHKSFYFHLILRVCFELDQRKIEEKVGHMEQQRKKLLVFIKIKPRKCVIRQIQCMKMRKWICFLNRGGFWSKTVDLVEIQLRSRVNKMLGQNFIMILVTPCKDSKKVSSLPNYSCHPGRDWNTNWVWWHLKSITVSESNTSCLLQTL